MLFLHQMRGSSLITHFEKTSTYEYSLDRWKMGALGGIRVPFVVRGPGINTGDQCDVPVSELIFYLHFLN